MKMHMLSGGRVRMRKSVFMPVQNKAETIEMPVISVLLRHGQANVLFDTGCHPSVPDDPEARWGGLARLMTPIMQPGDHVLTGLKEVGLQPEDIDIVVNSHLHPDHCGCNAFFTKATFVAHEKELAAARAEGAAGQGFLAAEFETPMPFDPIAAERDLMGDGRIVLLELPGHTPGTIGALVGLDESGQFLLASDTITLKECLDRDIIPRNTWNGEVLSKTYAEVRRIEAGGATVICGHDMNSVASPEKRPGRVHVGPPLRDEHLMNFGAPELRERSANQRRFGQRLIRADADALSKQDSAALVRAAQARHAKICRDCH